jgi:hypothetical protein
MSTLAIQQTEGTVAPWKAMFSLAGFTKTREWDGPATGGSPFVLAANPSDVLVVVTDGVSIGPSVEQFEADLGDKLVGAWADDILLVRSKTLTDPVVNRLGKRYGQGSWVWDSAYWAMCERCLAVGVRQRSSGGKGCPCQGDKAGQEGEGLLGPERAAQGHLLSTRPVLVSLPAGPCNCEGDSGEDDDPMSWAERLVDALVASGNEIGRVDQTCQRLADHVRTDECTVQAVLQVWADAGLVSIHHPVVAINPSRLAKHRCRALLLARSAGSVPVLDRPA